jgi:hypothetical protein
MKAYGWNGGIVPLILKLLLDVEGVCSALHLGRFTTGKIRGGT